MSLNFLDFELPIAELEAKIEELQLVNNGQELDLDLEDQISQLRDKNSELTKKIFSGLDPWQTARVARHPQRPYTLDYLPRIFTEFDELAGDRAYADDRAIVGGTARLDGRPVMVERGQSEAIAMNLKVMSRLNVPIICTVIGEGGSGGALAIGVGDKVNMLEYSTYSVISPEGCASILWKTAEKAPTAAAAMGITAKRIKELDLIDSVIEEPLGGAHRDMDQMAAFLKQALKSDLAELDKLSSDELIESRYDKLMSFGYC